MIQNIKRRRIAVIFTGGTIGSKVNQDGWIAPNKEEPYELIQLFQQIHPDFFDTFEFDCSMPYQILSENLSAEYLNRLICAVGDCLNSVDEQYDAIIICHGTDTLAYSAAMLAHVFGNYTIPIMLVSSNYPLADKRANGLANFYYALKSIDQVQGVAVPYRNSDGKTYVHRGDELLAHQTCRDDLYSIQCAYWGYYDENGEWIPRYPIQYGNENYDLMADQAMVENGTNWKNVKLSSDTRAIEWVRMYPGYRWGTFSIDTRYVMIEAYHSGTICLNDDLKQYIACAMEHGVPVYAVGVEKCSDTYETIKEYSALGLILKQCSPISLYCELWLKLNEDTMQ